MQNNHRHVIIILAACVLFMASCVSKKKYLESQVAIRYLKYDSTQLANKVNSLTTTVTDLQQQVADQKKLIADLQKKNADLQASASFTQTELTQRQKELQEQQQKLTQLQNLLDQQKQKSEELRKKMADALSGFAASDLTVTQKNGKVYVSLSENLLFPSGSAAVNAQGKEALGKLAGVLNANADISINIEGHTDSIPIRKTYEDNWALSLARSASIVRILTKDYNVDPVRVIASGHSEYDPVESNSTAEGRAKNRRTEIILSPKLDELYKLLEQ
ncbi:OmpA family protein [Panacibacter ginsenosidivorans]|uniref:OmpA family protein n=1 Tax=Panacibacter ginsenosidivorans TaxID=1813871 RepID=A0A5B8V7F9_9BACT|nr:OmpA family protein [Panacibacter ginsenosidivorans]QEC67262.1 OmpA family protein [Panacibacter ginsenosidivorans]